VQWKSGQQPKKKDAKKTESDESVEWTYTDSKQLENNGSFQNKNIIVLSEGSLCLYGNNMSNAIRDWCSTRVFEYGWVEYVPVFQNFSNMYLPIPWKGPWCATRFQSERELVKKKKKKKTTTTMITIAVE